MSRQQITTREELDALPEDSVIASIPPDEKSRLESGVAVWCKFNERWFGAGCTSADEVGYIVGEGGLFILYRPDEPQRVQPSIEAVARVFDTHRWKTMGVASVECECGEILYGVDSLTQFPADEAFRAHLATGVLTLVASQPTVAEVRVQALRDAADAARAECSRPDGDLCERCSEDIEWLREHADREAEGGAQPEMTEPRSRHKKSVVWCEDCGKQISRCVQCRGLDGAHKLDCSNPGAR